MNEAKRGHGTNHEAVKNSRQPDDGNNNLCNAFVKMISKWQHGCITGV